MILLQHIRFLVVVLYLTTAFADELDFSPLGTNRTNDTSTTVSSNVSTKESVTVATKESVTVATREPVRVATREPVTVATIDETEDMEEPESSFKVPSDPMEFMDYFEELIKTFRGKVDDIFEEYMPRVFEMSSTVILSSDCTFDMVRFLFALREMKPWAVKCKLPLIKPLRIYTLTSCFAC